MEEELCTSANSLCQLLDCDDACIVLSCADTTLSHPALNTFHQMYGQKHPYYGTIAHTDLLIRETIQAFCDMSLQTGQVSYVPTYALNSSQSLSILIAPLLRKDGCLGYVLCSAWGCQQFREGEQYLLAQACKITSADVERHLTWKQQQHIKTQQALATPASTSPDTLHMDAISCTRSDSAALVAMVGHDLRVPLTIIKGYVGLLQNYDDGEFVSQHQSSHNKHQSYQQHCYNVIMEQVDHLEMLVNDLFDTSRVQAGQLKLHPEPMALDVLCQRVAQFMHYRAQRQSRGRYTIHCICEQKLPPAFADIQRVRQVLINLIENAIKYSPSGGHIDVSIGACDQLYAFVTVRDYGIGIATHQQQSLFQPFQRPAQSTTSHTPGMGLGLYISRKLIEAMHGQITLTSREGRGTSVTFTLPLYQSPPVEFSPSLRSLSV